MIKAGVHKTAKLSPQLLRAKKHFPFFLPSALESSFNLDASYLGNQVERNAVVLVKPAVYLPFPHG